MFVRTIAVAAFATLTAFSPACAQAPRPLGDARSNALATRYSAQEWCLEPIRATQVAVHEYDGRLGTYSANDYAEQLLWSPSFVEGWAHYDEQMLVDEGWGNGDPHVRLAQLRGALLRECRYLVGSREHSAGMSVDTATACFETNAFVGHEPAHREALRGTAGYTVRHPPGF